MPHAIVPDSPVPCSSVGSKCGAPLWPAGIVARMEMKPVLVGSPVITAICAPGGKAGLPGPHFTPAGPLTTCMPAIGVAAVAGAGWVMVMGPAAESSTLTAAVHNNAPILMET